MSVLTGKTISEKGIITSMIDPQIQTQMVGIDLTVEKIETFLEAGLVDFDNKQRRNPRTIPKEFITDTNMWYLEAGAYLVSFGEIVDVPPNCMGLARPRSSLIRAGATMETSVWDPGYKGKSQSLLVVHNQDGLFLIEHARLMQIVFFQVDGKVDKLYSGKYQKEGLK